MSLIISIDIEEIIFLSQNANPIYSIISISGFNANEYSEVSIYDLSKNEANEEIFNANNIEKQESSTFFKQ